MLFRFMRSSERSGHGKPPFGTPNDHTKKIFFFHTISQILPNPLRSSQILSDPLKSSQHTYIPYGIGGPPPWKPGYHGTWKPGNLDTWEPGSREVPRWVADTLGWENNNNNATTGCWISSISWKATRCYNALGTHFRTLEVHELAKQASTL